MERSTALKFGAVALMVALYLGVRLSQDAPQSPPPEEAGQTEGAGQTQIAQPQTTKPQGTTPPGGSSPSGATTGAVTQLVKQELKPGTGAVAKSGDSVSVHYRGTLANGTKFDASYDRGKPFDFTLGQGQVIKGWDEGVAGMKVGGKRKLIVPPDMAYGASPPPGAPIPPNATLVFEVELLKVN